MADLADQIDDYICSFEGVGDLTMDTLAMLIFVWAILALFLLWLCKFLYYKYVKNNDVATNVVDTSKFGTSPSEKLRKSEPRELSASKDIKGLDLAAKPINKGIIKSAAVKSTTAIGGVGNIGGIAGSIGGGVIGQPIDTTRKRLSRKSPGPELRKPNRIILPPSNVVGPETTSVTWTSQVFRWLYSDLVIVNELLHSWILSINETLKLSANSIGINLEIVRVLPESPIPNLSNIYCHSIENRPSEMTTTLDCDAMPVLQIKTQRQKNGKIDTSHYKATISRLRARLIVTISYNTLKGNMKLEGFPDIRIALNSIGAIKTLDQDEKQLQDTVSENLSNAIRDSIYPVDFSIYSTCPRAADMDPPEISFNRDYLNINVSPTRGNTVISVSSGKRLLVKVVKGDGISAAIDPYCVVEMDEPPQKNQTGTRQGSNPYWDEHFLFDLSSLSAEILFEVYDRPTNVNEAPRFLGLGLVGIDELAVGPASSQVLALQPRPYETENISGAITVEFVFIEGAEVLAGRRPYKFKEALKITSQAQTNGYQNGHDLADTAIKALEGGALTTTGNPSKSTLIIHSVQRVELNKLGQIQMAETSTEQSNASLEPSIDGSTIPIGNNNINEVESAMSDCNLVYASNGLTSVDVMPGDEPPIAQSSPLRSQYNGHNSLMGNQMNVPIETISDSNTMDTERGRARKKRDFFGTIKRRLGRSKSRAKSMDRSGMIPIDTENPNGQIRSVSADRGVVTTTNTSTGPRLIVPTTLDQSRRSSLSESSAISGFSSASSKTFVHEASTLVLETLENGVKRHFLVPLAIAQRPRWRRKGTKLHIYNDHTFVAKHLSGGLSCDVCNRSIPRRPGKQGYECRDCLIKCHKQCHIRILQACTNPTVLSIELSKLNSAAADRSIRKL